MPDFPLPLQVQRPAACPELRLRLLAPSVDLNGDARDVLGDRSPFWAFAWAAGQVLARHVLDHPELVRGRCVLDLGTGSGLVAIAAARAGAARVVACDCDPAARAAARDNAHLNGVEIETADALAPLVAQYPGHVLLASDVLYDPDARSTLLAAAESVPLTLVADPERGPGPLPAELRSRLEPIGRGLARTLPDVDESTPGATLFCIRRVPLRLRPIMPAPPGAVPDATPLAARTSGGARVEKEAPA